MTRSIYIILMSILFSVGLVAILISMIPEKDCPLKIGDIVSRKLDMVTVMIISDSFCPDIYGVRERNNPNEVYVYDFELEK